MKSDGSDCIIIARVDDDDDVHDAAFGESALFAVVAHCLPRMTINLLLPLPLP